MRAAARLAGVAIAVGAGCAGAGPREVATPPPGTATPRATAAREAPARCGATVDVHALLARHARAYGSAEAVAAALPVTIDATIEIEGKTGEARTVLAGDLYRHEESVSGMASASGVDTSGAWALGAASGVVERLADDEAPDVRADAWFLWRGYLAFDPAKDVASCREDGGEARVDVAYARPLLGDPVVTFDLATASVLAIARRQADGKRLFVTIASWTTDPERGVRWPRKTADHPITGSPTTSTVVRVVAGLSCGARGAEQRGDACLAAPSDRVSLRWPASGRVRVPMTLLHGEILVRASIGGREAWAMLDSGAGITVVDATMPAGAAFTPAIEISGGGSTQKIRLGVGSLGSVAIGDLRAESVPAASGPIPALESFGAKRPELILGYTFFAGAAIRVDYKKREVVFAKTADGLAAPGARPVRVRRANGKMLAQGSVEGHAATFLVDTGSSGALDVVKKWATANGFPGDRKTVTVRGRFGAGTAETSSTYLRLGRASLGPIETNGDIADISDPPDGGDVSGLAGNGVFARCDAVVFDHARAMLVEGACDRAVPERKMGWRLAKKSEAAWPDRPWLVGALFPGAAAERAGIAVGDRVLEVGGKPATLDVEPLERVEEQASGTKVKVVVGRSGEKKTVTVELAPLLP